MWQLLWRHGVRITLSAIFLVCLYLTLTVYSIVHREQSLTREIWAAGGRVSSDYVGPRWIPSSYRDRRECEVLLNRITQVHLSDCKVTSQVIRQLGGLSELRVLDLRSTAVTDLDLEYLSYLPRLERILLRHTQITDVGLQHLQRTGSLLQVHARNTNVTAQGLEQLRRALPNCRVFPED